MRTLIQRVNHSSVKVDGKTIGEISRGLMVLVGFGRGDDDSKLLPMAQKILGLRIFPNEKGLFDLSVTDIAGGVLLIPQFTLYGDTSKGRRPDFFSALPPQEAAQLFGQFVEIVRKHCVGAVETGAFGADMKVALENDGPVTLSLEL